MIMAGTKAATLHEIHLIDIHGTRFYDLVFSHDDEAGTIRTARVGVEDAYSEPHPGDLVTVRYLMNVVVGLIKR